MGGGGLSLPQKCAFVIELRYGLNHLNPILTELPIIFMKNKNITRYTYENTDFQGWRVSIQRCGRIITRYFSDLYYGSEEESFREAIAYRDHVLSEMSLHRNNLPEYMDQELEHLQELLKEKEHASLPTRSH